MDLYKHYSVKDLKMIVLDNSYPWMTEEKGKKTHQKKDDVEAELDIGGTCSQAQKYQGLPTATIS